ncbi:MAG: response regulator [Planctomycetota bacterium]
MKKSSRLFRAIPLTVLASTLAIEGIIFIPFYLDFRKKQVAGKEAFVRKEVAEAAFTLGPEPDPEVLADSLMGPGVTGLQVLDARGNLLAQKGAIPTPLPLLGLSAQGFLLEEPLGRNGLRVRFLLPSGGIRAQLLGFIEGVLGLILLIAGSVTGSLFFVFQNRVRRPMARSARQIEKGKVSEGRSGRPCPGRFHCQDLIEEKTRAERAMKAARDSALEASRLKSEFLANMSHEIRTPIHGVMGMAGLLLDTPLYSRQKEYAETIQSSAETLLVLIDDLLDFSKIEAGQMALETADFELHPLLEDVVTLLAGQAQEKGLELALFIAPEVPAWLRGDPTRIRQVLTNLAANAVKFTESGEVLVQASLDACRGEKRSLRISVQDTGIGILPEQQGRLFDAFTQGDGSTSRCFGGTGLGLALSRRLVEMMGGRIGVESRPGRGSTFIFTLELEVSPKSPATPGISAPLRGTSPGGTRLDSLRVLVVDDNEVSRKILARQLGAWGMESETAGDGFRALEALERARRQGRPFDLALLDRQMPGMDGLELAQRIRKEAGLSELALVLLTPLSAPLSGEEVRKAGTQAQISKPVRPSQLLDSLARILGRAGEEPRPGPSGPAPSHQGRVLLAEDNPVNQKVALRILEKFGYEVDVAADGNEVLDLLARHVYDLVLMDCQMPHRDGFETTREIRKREEGEREASGCQLPIVAMTANALPGDRERCLEAGMDDYLSKPFKPEELLQVLERWRASSSMRKRKNPTKDIPIDKEG